MAGLGSSGLIARRSEVARLLRNEGATYNVTRDNQSRRQAWSLDPWPLVHRGGRVVGPRVGRGPAGRASSTSSSPTSTVSAGCVADGHIPAELVLGHPAFLRACVGMDVLRDPGGCSSPRWTWSVTGRASSGPSATGPRPPRDSATPWSTGPSSRGSCPTSTASPAWSAWPGSSAPSGPGWRRWRPRGSTNPGWSSSRRDLLSETYFEHAYLASYLGYPLVEGRDLVVNNNRVWLRTLAGFDPVDVVIRRVDDQWCDPVELRADSLLGVPGLLEVARRGRVTVLNPLGTGVIEDPALTGLLGDAGPDPARARNWPSGGPRPGGVAGPTS